MSRMAYIRIGTFVGWAIGFGIALVIWWLAEGAMWTLGSTQALSAVGTLVGLYVGNELHILRTRRDDDDSQA